MTRPEEIAAALNAWEQAYRFNELGAAGKELARLLRAANPPAGAEPCAFCRGVGQVESVTPGCPPLPCPSCSPEPATPAVGEADERLLAQADKDAAYLHSRNWNDMGFTVQHLAARVSALLADVARLKQAFDDEEKAGDLHRSINRRAAEALGKSNEGGNSSWHDIPEQITALRATLAAVRKIANDYHDVDVRGTPPREVACNPCANEILGVLEGRKP